ncbi:thiol:disulfide interchange protein DsbA [Marinospirillum celere]|uniref:Thiol:disulfide interchange protein n=1 Tax=Marinospirillum celere TaxID=1122252 RepID=A0A1I1IB87_9GAMM|nr:thiol:disulfide interchange protein DsbA/DsbL [Marinospirillum celere]SFC30550.1 thiol:disulfide interchange protein DsbA [Marinospirillum celere]
MFLFRALLLSLIAILSSNAIAEGYTTLNERVRPQVGGDKIEVTSIFSYTCPFCYQLEPQIEIWALDLAEDVELVHLPASFNAQWEHLARGYYIMEALDLTEQAHMALFDKIHQDRANMGSQRALRNFFADFGVDGDEVDSLYSSFGIESQIRQDKSRLRSYRVTGVPALIVDGQYVIDGNSAGSLENMLRVADERIESVRNSR